MAGLSPAEIAAPIRSPLSAYQRVRVRHEEVRSVDLAGNRVLTDSGPVQYDYPILCCGTRHAYFGNDVWEEHAPGLKSIPRALEIRRRVLTAYERAETETDRERHCTGQPPAAPRPSPTT